MALLIGLPNDVPLHTLPIMIRKKLVYDSKTCLQSNYRPCYSIAAYFSNVEAAVFAIPCLSVPTHCFIQYLTDHTSISHNTLILICYIADREKRD